jgi:hypothetical protein
MKTFMGNRDQSSGTEAISGTAGIYFQSFTGANAGFLHIVAGITTQAESGAVNIATFTDDFDGHIRFGNGGYPGGSAGFPTGGSAPDIGADEFDGVGIDLAGPSISYALLTNDVVAPTRAFNGVTITDASNVEGALGIRPRVYYKLTTDAVNNFNDNTSGTAGWKYVQANGATSPFDFTIDYSLLFGGGGVSVGSVVQYFVVAQDQAGTPNISINSGSFAAAPSSVALTGAAFPIGGTINSYNITASITGVKNVPGDYASLTLAGGAFEAINNATVTGNVTIQIASDLIGETGAITLNEFASPFTITIKPTGSARGITGSSSNALITLNGADRVTIDGSLSNTSNTVCPVSSASKDLTITNTSTVSTGAVVWFQSNGSNGATNNTVKNCNILGANPTTGVLFGLGSGSSSINKTSTGTGNINNSFINNNISKTQNGIYSGGASSLNKNTGTKINQNIMNTASPNNIQATGILVKFEDGVEIKGNNIAHISSPSSFSIPSSGIALGVEPSNTYTAYTGSDVINANVSYNKIDDVIQSTTGSAYGIVINAITSGTTLVSNNMISGISAKTATPSDLSAGILVGGGTGSTTNVFYNSVSILGATSGDSRTVPSYGLAIGGTTPIVNVKNNIFQNTQTSSGSGKNFAIGLAYTSTLGNYVNLTSNNNDFFISGSAGFIAKVGGFGNTSGTDKLLLSDWQTETGKDGASKNIAPVFTSSTDLHIVGSNPLNYQLNNTADGTTGVTDDIDCNTRATDIGADEFVFTACDIVSAGTATGSTSFCNSGSTTINSSGYSTGTGTTYLWQRSLNNFTTVLDSTVVVDPSSFATGTITTTTYYRLKVKCSSNSSSAVSNTITITVNIATASVSPPSATICSGTMVTLTETAGTGSSWLWSPGGATTSSIMVAPTMTTLYTVTVTGGGSCTATATSNVTVNPTPVASTGTYGPVCLNDPDVTLVGSPPGGTWSGTGVTGNTFDPNAGTQTLTYSVTDMGCSSSASTTIEVKAVMNWVFLPNGTTNGSCVSETNCCINKLCYGLQYTPAHTGNLTSYTTGFFVNCVSGSNPVISNSSCIMTNNSSETDECMNYSMVLFNSSGNTGVIPVTKNVPLILHKVCFNDPVGQTLTITEDDVTKLSTSLDVGAGYVNEFSCFTPFVISRSAPVAPANGLSTVACASMATPPGAPVIMDQCGSTLAGVLTNTVNVPTTITCEGTRTYTYTYTDCSSQTTNWTYTYTIEYLPFANPADNGITVDYPSDADVAPTAYLPVVTDNCGVTLSPSGPVVSDPIICNGIRTYTYIYTDCELNSQDWVFTYTVLHSTVVKNTNDSGNGSLRDVIACALDGETITFDPSLSGQTITLTTGEILINKNLTIQGLGKLNLTISGNYPNMASSRIFHLIAGKALTIKDLSLKNATADPNGGAIFVEGDLTLQEVLLENNFEGLASKGLTLVSPGTVTIIGNVEIKP